LARIDAGAYTGRKGRQRRHQRLHLAPWIGTRRVEFIGSASFFSFVPSSIHPVRSPCGFKNEVARLRWPPKMAVAYCLSKHAASNTQPSALHVLSEVAVFMRVLVFTRLHEPNWHRCGTERCHVTRGSCQAGGAGRFLRFRTRYRDESDETAGRFQGGGGCHSCRPGHGSSRSRSRRERHGRDSPSVPTADQYSRSTTAKRIGHRQNGFRFQTETKHRETKTSLRSPCSRSGR